ncbi:FeoA family protein [Agathobaculum sp.]|uniref:FeoA family protein n=1 Tax=Agathobaculum sp. TaxID=2048138 RepID=UPI002A8028C2|nr:FeoA family protein [Agathobaculum sp.]MDY3617444.1 FeoA family protein [Agathobaculum sp.]
MKTLGNLKPGEVGVVDHITAEGALKRHFLDMGITKGVPVMMERIAPFGDPVAVRLRGYSLSLRREEAKKIVLERTHEE